MLARTKKLGLTVGMALGLLFAVTLLFHGPLFAADQCVDPLGAGGCMTTVQAAVNAAADSDTIRVMAGTYAENLVITKTVTLLGGCTHATCNERVPGDSVIDGSGSMAPVLRVLDGANPTIDGFTIRGGDATHFGGMGGGILIQSAAGTIRNSVIRENVGSSDVSVNGRGGGIHVISPTVPILIEDNLIEYNVAYSVVLTSATVAGAGWGGGISIGSGEATISNNRLQYNRGADTGDAPNVANGFGGAISILDATSATVISNTIEHNVGIETGRLGFGGGIDISARGAVTVTENRIVGNTGVMTGSSGGGGGMYVYYNNRPQAHIRILANEILDNVGTGSTATSPLFDSSLYANGGAVYAFAYSISGAQIEILSNTMTGNVASTSMHVFGDREQGRASGGALSIVKAGSALIENNIIEDNVSALRHELESTNGFAGTQKGGGCVVDGASVLTITHNLIRNNTVVVDQVVTEAQTSADGGGLWLGSISEGLVHENLIAGNTAVDQATFSGSDGLGYSANGGGIAVGDPNTHVRLVGNSVTGNSGAKSLTNSGTTGYIWSVGGALSVFQSENGLVESERNLITHNTSYLPGLSGAVIGVYQNRFHATNDMIVNNSPSGIEAASDTMPAELVLQNVTVAANGWAAVYARGSALTSLVTNSILSGHNVGLKQDQPAGSQENDYNLLMNDTDYDGFSAGAHDLAGVDPSFVNPGGDNFHIQYASPARNTGNNAGAPTSDFEGDARPFLGDGVGIADMGADEWVQPAYTEKAFVPLSVR